MRDNLSESDTNQTSFEDFQQQISLFSQLRLNSGLNILKIYRRELLKFGFKKIFNCILPYHPQKASQFLQSAQKNLRQRKWKQAKQEAQRTLVANKKQNIIVFQRAIYILTECSIFQNQIQWAKKWLQKIEQHQKIQIQYQFLLLKTKICLKQKKNQDAQNCIERIEQILSKQSGNGIQNNQKGQILLFCSQSLIQLNKYEVAYNLLQKWLPVLIQYQTLPNSTIFHVYNQLAEICLKKNNLKHQFTYLCCALLTISRSMHLDYHTYIEIQGRKIQNLIKRQLFLKASDQIRKVLLHIPHHHLNQQICIQIDHIKRQEEFVNEKIIHLENAKYWSKHIIESSFVVNKCM